MKSINFAVMALNIMLLVGYLMGSIAGWLAIVIMVLSWIEVKYTWY